jgi:hypothetical protein
MAAASLAGVNSNAEEEFSIFFWLVIFLSAVWAVNN